MPKIPTKYQSITQTKQLTIMLLIYYADGGIGLVNILLLFESSPFVPSVEMEIVERVNSSYIQRCESFSYSIEVVYNEIIL
jgi:hypothetical protein